MDRLSKERRSWNMSRIRGRNTRPEIIVRSVLHALGYRFRLHVANLVGRPDIVLPKHRTVVFVHGCFWHRHARCPQAYFPKSRTSFWKEKFRRNVERDARVRRLLRSLGWRIVVIWECETTSRDALASRLKKLLAAGHRP